jgi:hypothetical protein
MGCALTEPDDYPNYLKKILKEIELGNDKKLKACACSLITPVNNDGCPILDSNKKIAAFPFCIEEVESITEGFIGTLEQMMTIWWRVKKWKIKISGYSVDLDNGYTYIFNDIDYEIDPIAYPIKQEGLVCADGFYFETPLVELGTVSINSNSYALLGELQLQIGPVQKCGDIFVITGRAATDFDDGWAGFRTNSGDMRGDMVVGSWSMKFDEGLITGTLFTQAGSWPSNTSLNMTISAAEYWP